MAILKSIFYNYSLHLNLKFWVEVKILGGGGPIFKMFEIEIQKITLRIWLIIANYHEVILISYNILKLAQYII